MEEEEEEEEEGGKEGCVRRTYAGAWSHLFCIATMLFYFIFVINR